MTGSSIRGLINYNESKVAEGLAALILANRFGLDIEQLELRHKVARFEHLTKLNSRVKTNAVHIMLNFDRSDKVDTAILQTIATTYMERIGFSDQPFLVYQHQDVSHPHIHIVSTNVKSDATRMNLHNIGKTLSETARKEIEIEFGLIKAEGRGREQVILPVNISAADYGSKPTKRSIYNVVTAVLRSYKFSSLAEFNAVLRDFNIVADRGAEDSVMFEKRGLVYSVLDDRGNRVGIPFKASAFAGKPTLSKVEGKFALNAERRKLNADPLKEIINRVLQTGGNLNRMRLMEGLRKEGISLHFRENNEGRIYGVTYVDHNTRTVFNGSDLGKQYSAKAVLERLAVGKVVPAKVPPSLETVSRTGGLVSGHHHDRSSTSPDLLEFLMEKPAYEPPMALPLRRRKKKKKKGMQRNIP